MKEGQKYLIRVVTDTYIVHNSCALFCGYTFGMIHNHTAVTGISSEGFKKKGNPGNRAHSFNEEHGEGDEFLCRPAIVLARVGSGAIDSNADVVHPHQCHNLGCVFLFFFLFFSFLLFILLACLPFHFFFGPIN